jgi:hypothetical protein
MPLRPSPGFACELHRGVGFSRSVGNGSGPGLELQSDRAFTKFPTITGLPFAVLSSLGPSALDADPNNAMTAVAISGDLNRWIIFLTISSTILKGPLFDHPVQRKRVGKVGVSIALFAIAYKEPTLFGTVFVSNDGEMVMGNLTTLATVLSLVAASTPLTGQDGRPHDGFYSGQGSGQYSGQFSGQVDPRVDGRGNPNEGLPPSAADQPKDPLGKADINPNDCGPRYAPPIGDFRNDGVRPCQ